jgi:nucleoside-diphosphate-sugar epimerase
MDNHSTILVTGGTGFVGAHLLYHLTLSGKHVKALKRSSSSTGLTRKTFSWYAPFSIEQWERIYWIEGDIMDIPSLQEAFDGVDYVYHVAAIVSFQKQNKSTIESVNQVGTANVVNIALEKHIRKLLYVSSIGTLGRVQNTDIVSETTYWSNKKTSVYSKSKYEAEQEVWRGMAEGLTAVIVNPSIIIGPGNWNQGSPQLFETMWKGLKFFTSGSNGFVGVNDVAKLMIQLMDRDLQGERYILSSENVLYEQLFNWMADALQVARPKYKAGLFLSAVAWRFLALAGLFTGRKSSITKETAETANQQYRYSNAKILAATGVKFMPVKDCIEQTAGIFLDAHR